MTAATLKKSILQYAIQGKLVPQNSKDEPASVLLATIREEKKELIKQGKLKKEKPLAPVTEDEKPFDIPESWEWVRLGEINSLADGEKMFAKKLPYLEAKYLRGNIEPKILEEGQFVKAKDKLILVDGENSGEVFELCEDGYLGSTFKVLIINNQVNERYYRLLMLCYKDYFRDNKKGEAIPHLNRALFRELCIGLPPLAEQQRIVAKIEELMTLVDKYGKLETELETLEKQFPERLKKSILQHAIQGKLVPQLDCEGNAKTLLDAIKKEKQELMKQGKLKKEKPLAPITEEEKPFDIPDTWEWVRLGEWFNIVNGFTPLRTNKFFWDKGTVNWFTVEDIKQGRIIHSTKQFITAEALGKSTTRVVPKNSLLLCCTASVGEYAIADIPLTTNQQFNAIYPKMFFNNAIDMYFLFSIAPLFQDMLQNVAGTTTFPFISVAKVSNFIIPLPPLAEQQRIVAKIEELFALVDLISQGKRQIKGENYETK